MRQVPVRMCLKSDALKKKIYVLSEGMTVQYVGLAVKQSVQERLLNHAMNYFSRKRRSRLTELIFYSKIFYGDWTISILGLDEVSSFAGKKIHCLKCAERETYDYLKFEKGAILNGNYRAPYACRVHRKKKRN